MTFPQKLIHARIINGGIFEAGATLEYFLYAVQSATPSSWNFLFYTYVLLLPPSFPYFSFKRIQSIRTFPCVDVENFLSHSRLFTFSLYMCILAFNLRVCNNLISCLRIKNFFFFFHFSRDLIWWAKSSLKYQNLKLRLLNFINTSFISFTAQNYNTQAKNIRFIDA